MRWHICAGTGLELPHLRRDWAPACHICAGTGLDRATSAIGSDNSRHICAGTDFTPATHICARAHSGCAPAEWDGPSARRRSPPIRRCLTGSIRAAARAGTALQRFLPRGAQQTTDTMQRTTDNGERATETMQQTTESVQRTECNRQRRASPCSRGQTADTMPDAMRPWHVACGPGRGARRHRAVSLPC